MDAVGSLRRTVVISNPQGLHMRPAMAFARLAQQFQSTVLVCHGDRCVNGKSLIDLMLLAAMPGVELQITVAGSDAQRALDPLAGILAAADPDELPTIGELQPQ